MFMSCWCKKKAIKRKVWWSLHLTLRRFQDDIPAQVSDRLISVRWKRKTPARPAARGRDAGQQGRIRTWANLSRNLKAFCFSEARKRSITFLSPIDARKGRRHGSPRYPLSTLLLGDTAEFSRPCMAKLLYLVRRLLVRESSIDKQSIHDLIFPSLLISCVAIVCPWRSRSRCTSTVYSWRVDPWWLAGGLARALPSSVVADDLRMRSERRGKAPLLSAPAVVEPFPIPSSGEHRHRSVKAKGAGDGSRHAEPSVSVSFPDDVMLVSGRRRLRLVRFSMRLSEEFRSLDEPSKCDPLAHCRWKHVRTTWFFFARYGTFVF